MRKGIGTTENNRKMFETRNFMGGIRDDDALTGYDHFSKYHKQFSYLIEYSACL